MKLAARVFHMIVRFATDHLNSLLHSRNIFKATCGLGQIAVIGVLSHVPQQVIWTKKHLLDEAGHKCKNCKRTFGKETHLKKHLKVHTFGKQFFCDSCRKMFQKSRYLSSHIKTQHCPKGQGKSLSYE